MSNGAPPASPVSAPSPGPSPTTAPASAGARSAASAVLVLAWSSGFVGAALAAPHAPAVTTLAWRLSTTAVLLLGVLALRRRRIARRAVVQHVALGLVMQVVYLGGVFGAASAGVAAGTIALVAATQPLVVLALSKPLLGLSARPVQVGALAVGVLGVGAVVAGDVADGSAPWWALALPVLSTLSLATGTVLQQRWEPRCSLLDALTVQATTAALVLCAAAAATGNLRPPLTSGFGLAVAWTVVLSGMGGYGAYLLTLRLMGPAAVSTLLLLTPPVTTLWAWAMLGQTPGPWVLPGAALCAGAVLVALRAGGGRPGGGQVARGPAPALSPPASRCRVARR